MAEFIPNLNIDIQAVILAGGRGTRMHELSDNSQKCMFQIQGIPILEHILIGLHDVFGHKAQPIIATGYQGEQISSYFGDSYSGMKITYVHGPTELPTTGRLLLAKDYLVNSFLFLAGDILTPNIVLEQIATNICRVGVKDETGKYSLGILGGATNHEPAPTHALLSPNGDYLNKITFPPTKEYGTDDLREMHRSLYATRFLDLLARSKKETISEVIGEANSDPEFNFLLSRFTGEWAHYAEMKDLEKYKAPIFI